MSAWEWMQADLLLPGRTIIELGLPKLHDGRTQSILVNGNSVEVYAFEPYVITTKVAILRCKVLQVLIFGEKHDYDQAEVASREHLNHGPTPKKAKIDRETIDTTVVINDNEPINVSLISADSSRTNSSTLSIMKMLPPLSRDNSLITSTLNDPIETTNPESNRSINELSKPEQLESARIGGS